jgi:diacylglycerol kinase family enzyme
MATKLHVLLNSHSGSASGVTAEELKASIERTGFDVVVDDAERDLIHRVKVAAASDAPFVVAAGGDGTVTAVAGALAGTEKTLVILPLGTANLLAKDLKIPLSLDSWLAALPQMTQRKIDVARVNGRVFLHKVVLGAVPGIAKAREQLRDNLTLPAIWSFVVGSLERLSRARRLAVEIIPKGGDRRIEIVQAIAVANNDYDEGVGRFFCRSCLNGGSLSLYVVRHLSGGDAIRLMIEMMFGNWRQDEAFEVENVEAVTIKTRRRRVTAMIDGEVEVLGTPLRFSIEPEALCVLAPAEQATKPVDQEPAEAAVAS